jgi:hypothetical protein
MNAPFSAMTPDAPQVVVFTSSMRRLIADAIESLILLLDEIDGDPDHEIDDDFEGEPDEPSLGATDDLDQSISWLSPIGEVDAEHEHDGREVDADFERTDQPAVSDGAA